MQITDKNSLPSSNQINYKSNQPPKFIQYATLTGASSLLQLAQVGTNINKGPLGGTTAASSSIPTSGNSEVTLGKPYVKEDNEATETIFISQDQTVEIPGQNVTYVLITTDENEQQLVPVSKIAPDTAR